MLCLAEVLAEAFYKLSAEVFDELSAEVFRIILLLIQHSFNAIDCFWCLCCFAFVVGDLAEVPRKIRGCCAEVK